MSLFSFQLLPNFLCFALSFYYKFCCHAYFKLNFPTFLYCLFPPLPLHQDILDPLMASSCRPHCCWHLKLYSLTKCSLLLHSFFLPRQWSYLLCFHLQNTSLWLPAHRPNAAAVDGGGGPVIKRFVAGLSACRDEICIIKSYNYRNIFMKRIHVLVCI